MTKITLTVRMLRDMRAGRLRYSRKAWRLKKEIEKITDTPQYKKASDNAMHNTLIGAPVEVIFRPDGSVEVPRYQIGGNDCEICR